MENAGVIAVPRSSWRYRVLSFFYRGRWTFYGERWMPKTRCGVWGGILGCGVDCLLLATVVAASGLTIFLILGVVGFQGYIAVAKTTPPHNFIIFLLVFAVLPYLSISAAAWLGRHWISGKRWIALGGQSVTSLALATLWLTGAENQLQWSFGIRIAEFGGLLALGAAALATKWYWLPLLRIVHAAICKPVVYV